MLQFVPGLSLRQMLEKSKTVPSKKSVLCVYLGKVLIFPLQLCYAILFVDLIQLFYLHLILACGGINTD